MLALQVCPAVAPAPHPDTTLVRTFAFHQHDTSTTETAGALRDEHSLTLVRDPVEVAIITGPARNVARIRDLVFVAVVADVESTHERSANVDAARLGNHVASFLDRNTAGADRFLAFIGNQVPVDVRTRPVGDVLVVQDAVAVAVQGHAGVDHPARSVR